MKWNESADRIDVFLDGELTSFGNAIDSTGRFFVQFGQHSATVDVVDGLLFIAISGPDGDANWLGPLDSNLDPSLTIIQTQARECVCKGSNKLCDGGPADCQGQQPCTKPDNSSSWCVFATRPNQPAPNNPGWCGETEVVPFLVIPPGLLFAKNMRRGHRKLR